jgi:alpha-L-fucosidase 2
MITIFRFVVSAAIAAVVFSACASHPHGAFPSDDPPPVGPVPSSAQRAWHQMEYYAFVHFNMNTFTNREWGEGNENPALFNPSQLDCRQWVDTFRRAGMKGVILTAKHHDGFCLWPSKYTKHSVASSPWRGGKGDVVRELSQACREAGLKMGIYISPWDRNCPFYGDSSKYNEYFKNQLRELLTQYGDIFEVWFDGACGEGPNGKKQVYDWPAYIQVVRECQPNAVIFSDAGPDVRWVGNEAGLASGTCWSTLDREKFYPGTPDSAQLTEGHENGTHWVPAECDVSIRPGWYYHPEEDSKVKSVAQLMDIYYRSVGQNGSLLLNIPVDRRGLVHENDAARLLEFRGAIDRLWSHELSKGARSLASGVRMNSPRFQPGNALDHRRDTCWVADDADPDRWISMDLDVPAIVEHVVLSEAIEFGQRVRKFRVEGFDGTAWRVLAEGTTIGNKRILNTNPMVSRAVRLVIADSKAAPAIAEFHVYGTPAVSPEVSAGPALLRLESPISRWDEALPVGNGTLGGLLWGGDHVLKLSLDRGDLWDLRVPETLKKPEWNYAKIRELVENHDQKTLSEWFDVPYDTVPYPTKLPAGRMELSFAGDASCRAFTLDLERALASADLGSARAELIYHATEPVALMRVAGADFTWRLLPPAGVARLAYPPAVEGSEGHVKWYVQSCADGFQFAVVAESRQQNGATAIALSIATNRSSEDPLAVARAAVRRVLDRGWEVALHEHSLWWSRFWDISRVAIPDAQIQRQYDLCKYYYGSASRPGAPPMPLQGLWTADEGGLPPWKGDYHNDLNTQMTYLACHTAGLREAEESFIQFNWKLLPRFREFARNFYGVAGAAVPGVMALDGQALGGWAQYSLSPTMGAWVAHSFYLQWKHHPDARDLRDRLYPFCKEIGTTIAALIYENAEGRLRLPLSSSPEIFDNSYRAWLPPNSNFDLALLRWLFGALAEMATALDEGSDAQRWTAYATSLEYYDVDPATGSLTCARGVPFSESHRHFSHALAIHPLGILNVRGDARDVAVIRSTMRELSRLGTSAWCGYSFAWMACLCARTGDAAGALDYLQKFVSAFCGRNGFHLNGDQSGTGLSSFTYRPFTLEGNFTAMQAVHEMLLQSWGGLIMIAPAIPDAWKEIRFQNLVAEGGARVSARVDGGITTALRIVAPDDAGAEPVIIRLADPFRGATAKWVGATPRLNGGVYEFKVEPGADVTAYLDLP